eukprot:jgi/Tetstr1/435769/TSEL_024662.t1
MASPATRQDEESGRFVYIALHPLVVRTGPSVCDKWQSELAVEPGENIAADLRRQDRTSGKPHGPFPRLSDGDGWLFERKSNKRMTMEPLLVSTGLWCYRVDNERGGLALRGHPTRRSDLHCDLEQLFPHDMVFGADRNVEAGGTTFVRVQGTAGWLFETIDGKHTLMPCDPTVGHPVPTNQQVRTLVAQHRLTELLFNETNRVISFVSRQTEEGTVRIHVYYTTGTVGTCLEHPGLGRTQIYRRGCTLEQLAEIMSNPRAHTEKGYYKRGAASVGDAALVTVKAFMELFSSEEMALRSELRVLEEETAGLAKQREVVLQLLHAREAERAAVAKAQLDSSNEQNKDEAKRKRARR